MSNGVSNSQIRFLDDYVDKRGVEHEERKFVRGTWLGDSRRSSLESGFYIKRAGKGSELLDQGVDLPVDRVGWNYNNAMFYEVDMVRLIEALARMEGE